MMITKLFPGLVAVIVVAVLMVIAADRIDEVMGPFFKTIHSISHM